MFLPLVALQTKCCLVIDGMLYSMSPATCCFNGEGCWPGFLSDINGVDSEVSHAIS